MDRPKGEVSFLERFPPDIWAFIVWYLPGEQLLRLMMTGATFLWHRLQSPNVVKSIILGEDFLTFKSLPRIFKDFPSLEELKIHSCGEKWSDEFGLTIDSIPSGVRTFEMSGAWGEPKLFGETGSLHLSKHLPRLENLSLSTLHISDSSWMTHCPQSLTNLKLRHWDGKVEIPSSVLHFTVDTVHLSQSSFVSKLPPSLVSFVVDYEIHLDLAVRLLPVSILKLSLGSGRVEDPEALMKQLPSLTCLKAALGLDFEIYPALTSLLPSTLTELDIASNLPCSAWPLLPQNLSKLSFAAPESLCTVVSNEIDDHGEDHAFKTIPFDYLPKSITSLELRFAKGQYFFGPPPTSNRSFFPPQLRYLSIPALQLSPETAKLLPSSLTHLEIGNLCERVCEHLPTGLRKLISYRTLMSPNFTKFLPKSLTFLHLWMTASKSKGAWFDYISGERVESISKLPEYSTHMNCLSKSFDWKDTSPLPSTLTYFGMSHADDLADTFMEHQQLPNLFELRLTESTNLSDLTIPYLSPSLKSLDLASSSAISGKSFQFLPKCLTSLNLSSSEQIFDSDIQHLCRTLKFVFFSSAIHLTELCLRDLPPHLEILDLSDNSLISPYYFLRFPYSLQSIQIPHSVDLKTWYVKYGQIWVRNGIQPLSPTQIAIRSFVFNIWNKFTAIVAATIGLLNFMRAGNR